MLNTDSLTSKLSELERKLANGKNKVAVKLEFDALKVQILDEIFSKTYENTSYSLCKAFTEIYAFIVRYVDPENLEWFRSDSFCTIEGIRSLINDVSIVYDAQKSLFKEACIDIKEVYVPKE